MRGLWAWRPVTNPTARVLASWFCALWGRHEGAKRGAPLAWVWGVQGRALSHARPSVLGACGQGPATNWLWVRPVWAWGPVTNPTARALASWFCALGQQLEGIRGGGGASCLGLGRSGLGALPWPTARPWGVRLEPGTNWLLVRGCGRGDASPTPQRALWRAGFARCGGSLRAPGGGASCLVVGHPGLSAPPRPTARPGGVPLGPATHWLWVRGGVGVGTRHQLHSA